MTFEGWADSKNLTENGKAETRAAWQAAQQAERERVTAIAVKVRAQGNVSGTAWWDSAEEIRRLINEP